MLAWSLSLTYMQAGYRNHTTSTVSICFSYAYKGDPFCCMFVFSICAICKFKEAHSLVCILKINTILAIFTFEGYAYCVYFGKKKHHVQKMYGPFQYDWNLLCNLCYFLRRKKVVSCQRSIFNRSYVVESFY